MLCFFVAVECAVERSTAPERAGSALVYPHALDALLAHPSLPSVIAEVHGGGGQDLSYGREQLGASQAAR